MTILPLYNPDFLNGATGLPFLLADEPGEIDTYPAGFPPDWGDVNGDGSVGSSDIFGSITLSPDMKTIFFSDGLIPVGGRFTDFNDAMITAGESAFLAGIDASFTGTAVPEPATLILMSAGGAVLAMRRHQGRRARR